ncbi:dna repair protein rad5 [Phaffia rhodozyma]|uniref:Dna repair protein rad5 n=1 Tax=Phaffia rhodozyma TaxID=264483 RepID=A0A0F7SUJ0_PHARH|nr:dna repair protein rad5 [Phaffia rhodozyma]
MEHHPSLDSVDASLQVDRVISFGSSPSGSLPDLLMDIDSPALTEGDREISDHQLIKKPSASLDPGNINDPPSETAAIAAATTTENTLSSSLSSSAPYPLSTQFISLVPRGFTAITPTSQSNNSSPSSSQAPSLTQVSTVLNSDTPPRHLEQTPSSAPLSPLAPKADTDGGLSTASSILKVQTSTGDRNSSTVSPRSRPKLFFEDSDSDHGSNSPRSRPNGTSEGDGSVSTQPTQTSEDFQLDNSLLTFTVHPPVDPSDGPSTSFQSATSHSAASGARRPSRTPSAPPSNSKLAGSITKGLSGRLGSLGVGQTSDRNKQSASSDSDSEIEYMSGLTPVKNEPSTAARTKSIEVKQEREAPGSIKRKLSFVGNDQSDSIGPQPTVLPEEGGYLGEFVVEGYTMVKGKGYCQPGSAVFLSRIEPQAGKARPNPSNVSSTGAQRSLKDMMKPKVETKDNSKAPKVKPNTIIRLKNDRGFEIGKLPIKTTSWLAPLLDLHLLTIKGTIVHCDVPISRVGDTIVLSLDVWLKPEAFVEIDIKRPLATEKTAILADSSKPAFGVEGLATEEEIRLGKRKDGLKVMFQKIGLRPRRSSSISNKKLKSTGITKPFSLEKGKTGELAQNQPEVGSTGDEDEAGDEIDEDQLDSIYAKAQKDDRELDEMEPAKTFTLTLRPYQKQALKWMADLERGLKSSRDSALHPLWQEYAFAPEKQDFDSGEIVDLEHWVEPNMFYYNPYSGELSLKFPRVDQVCRGGILADSMGMGKTL